MGDGVNIAARLESIAEPGSILVSEDAWRQARGRVAVEFVDIGERHLKNIELPVRAYSISPRALETSVGLVQGPSRAVYPPLPDKPSIAVLPFLNLTGDPDQEYFADAITEDIVTALSRWRWFFVIARNSSFAYKNRAVDVKQIGRELGVRFVLEGSVQRSGTRVRATGQLIDCATGAHVWADTVEGDMADIFALQDEITAQVVTAIEPAMLQSEGARVVRKDPVDLSAFDCFQRGMWQFNKMTRESWREALSLFREAVARDRELSHGHSGIARALYTGVAYAWTTAPERDLAEAEQVAQAAIRLDARDAYGHFALSGTLLYHARHQEALDEARRAIMLNPNFAYGHFRLGQVLTYIGRPAEAVAPIERSMRHSPYDPQLGPMLAQLALAHYQARNYPEATLRAQAAISLRYSTANAVAAASLARLGRKEEARSALEAFLPGFQQQLASRTIRLVPYANAADQAHLFEGLRLRGVGQAMLDALL
jgi:TolB-like protein